MLLVVGEKTDFKETFKTLIDSDESQHRFSEAETVVISSAGHMVHLEQPEKLAAAAERFFIRSEH